MIFLFHLFIYVYFCIANSTADHKIFNQSEINVLKFKCRGKLFVEASEKDIESLKNQNDNFKWFV